MPTYVYRIVGTDERFEAVHRMSQMPQTLGELCEVAGLDLAGRDPQLPVERLIQPVQTKIAKFNAEIRNSGLTKLERRDKGVYEDVTKPKGERTIIKDNGD